MKFSQFLCLTDFYIICSIHHGQSIVTSSRRHFVFWPQKLLSMISSIPSIRNHSNFVHVIFMSLSIKWHHMRPCARHDARTRVRQILKMLQSTYNFFWTRFRPFWAFRKFPRVPVRARVFAHTARTEGSNAKFVLGSHFLFVCVLI